MGIVEELVEIWPNEVCDTAIADGVWNTGVGTGIGALKGAKGTISLAQAKDVVPDPNCMLKSL